MKTLIDLKQRLRTSLKTSGIEPYISGMGEGHACINIYLKAMPPSELIALLPHEFENISISWIFDGRTI